MSTTIDLPFPIPQSQCFKNAKRRGRVKTDKYIAWIDEAGWILKSQHPKPIAGPVVVHILVEDKGNGDGDNTEKCIFDLLVRHRIIEDDRRKFVRGHTNYWSKDVTGCRVTITPETEIAA